MIFLTSLIRRVHFFVGCPHTYIFRRCCFSLVTLFLFVVFTFLVCVYLTCLLYIWSDLAANLEGKGIWRFDFDRLSDPRRSWLFRYRDTAPPRAGG
jgi:hypothetical protein